MKIAVITPYFNDSLQLLKRGHESVLAQEGVEAVHFLVADGKPYEEIDSWKCTHITIPHVGDFGNVARGTGAAIAAAQEFDAICFLDPDAWFDPNHLAEMVATREMFATQIITCYKNLYRVDNMLLAVDSDSDGQFFNDINCYLFFKNSFNLLKLLMFKEKNKSAIINKLLWDTIRSNNVKTAHSYKNTVNQTTMFANHYIRYGEEPPPNSRIFTEIKGESKMVTYDFYLQMMKTKEEK